MRRIATKKEHKQPLGMNYFTGHTKPNSKDLKSHTHFEYADGKTLCGKNAHYLLFLTFNPDMVTCLRCKEALERCAVTERQKRIVTHMLLSTGFTVCKKNQRYIDRWTRNKEEVTCGNCSRWMGR